MKNQFKDYKIAFLGKCGVGKSSLINKIFDLNLPSDSVEECTKNILATWIRNENDKFNFSYDSIMVMDTPGIAAALDNDEFYMPFYHHALSLADCVVWVVQGNTRADKADQEMLLRLKPFFREETKVILCVNMVDKIGTDYKENWDIKINKPNEEMKELIKQRCDDLIRKFHEIDFSFDEVTSCSALKNYNLETLFNLIKGAKKEEMYD